MRSPGISNSSNGATQAFPEQFDPVHASVATPENHAEVRGLLLDIMPITQQYITLALQLLNLCRALFQKQLQIR
ncbi:hypothetical protein JOE32_000907 [Pseudomonas sp. PvP025]|nr:hypothetical protein [Pseudomonas sp. PvP025]MDQ0398300.1 hypothetical protein [Pseudomonas sp. PvP006]